MTYLALALYLLGSIFILTFMEPEEGYERDIKVLAAFWPFFTVYVMFMDVFFPSKEDEDKE